MRWIAGLSVLVGCAPSFPVSPNLVSSGFGGATLSGDGWWLHERLWWTDGSRDDEYENHFVLATDDDPCADWDQTATAADYGTYTDPVDQCEARRDSYRPMVGIDVPDELTIEFDLWRTD